MKVAIHCFFSISFPRVEPGVTIIPFKLFRKSDIFILREKGLYRNFGFKSTGNLQNGGSDFKILLNYYII